jgi:hypothetical protein
MDSHQNFRTGIVLKHLFWISSVSHTFKRYMFKISGRKLKPSACATTIYSLVSISISTTPALIRCSFSFILPRCLFHAKGFLVYAMRFSCRAETIRL